MLLSKKIFIASSSVLLVIFIFWGIYQFSFKESSSEKSELAIPPAESLAEKNPFTQINKPKEEIIQEITPEPVLAPILAEEDTALQYYAKNTGNTYQIDLLTLQKKTLSTASLPGLIDVFWSPDRTKVLSKFSGATQYPTYSFYNLSSATGNKLDESIGTIAWQNNQKIFYTYFNKKDKTQTINLSDPDGKNWTKITTFSADSLLIAPIPKSSFISFWNKPDSFSKTLLQSTPILGGETKTISAEVFGADYLWSTDGALLLRSNVNKRGGHLMELGFSNSLGGEYKNLGIPTFVSKCAWSKNNNFIFYALPGSISEKNILPNDYLNGSFVTNDTFWKVNLKTGEKTRLVPLEKLVSNYDATDLFLSDDENYLFFINKIDSKVYRIKL